MVLTELESLVALLEDWSKWQSSYRPKNGFNSRSAGFISGGINCYDDLDESVQRNTLTTIDTCVNDLAKINPAQGASIYRRYGIASVFRFPRANYETTLIEAHSALIVICKRKGVVL